MERLAVFDACLDKRNVQRWDERGHPSTSFTKLGIAEDLDEDALPKLSDINQPWVLITGDDKMPLEHTQCLLRLLTDKAVDGAVATIDGDRRGYNAKHGTDYNPEQFKMETIQRWGHKMIEQKRGTIIRYNPKGGRTWRARAAQTADVARRDSVAE